MKLFKKAKKGFTLVELVVVIAVIAILSAVSVGAYFGITDSANGSKCTQEAKAIHTAMMVIANDPEVEGIDITTAGLVLTGVDEEAVIDALEEETGVTYVVDTYEATPAAGTDTKLYIKNGANFGYYTTAGKKAQITWTTGEVELV